MSNSTRRPSGGKPKKPRKDFPLYPHRAGYWAKKVRGKTVYFGKVADDPKGTAALELWLEQKDDLLAGREPRAKSDALTVADLCNQFLAHKEHLRDTGKLNPRTFRGHYDICATVVRVLSRNRAVVDLAPDDFRKLRARLAKTRGPVALRNEMQRVRGIFKFAFDQGLILAPIRFGQSFAKPKLDVVRRAWEAHRAEHGDRMFEAAEVRLILATAKQPLRAMVLLAANGGLGQTDLSSLPLRAVDLDAGWLDFARVKTGVRRRIPLWPETIAAIRQWLPQRPKAKDKADAGLLFLTCRGARWIKVSAKGAPKDAIGQEFGKVLRKLGLKRPRLSFYGLRHGFETIAGETADQVAVDSVMGHVPQGMAAVYRERISDGRLRAVTEHVRRWLFGEGPDDSKGARICGPCEPPQRDEGDDAGPALRLYTA